MLWSIARTAARWLVFGTAAAWSALASPAHAQSAPEGDIGGLVSEAAERFAIPQQWITAVMRQESAFNRQAVSHAGAMGLMQVMPQTYAGLRLRYGLGADPFEPRNNIMAGAAYLREMYDRFGSPGFLAAYNAGPARYAEHLTAGRRLPLETRNYLAKLAPQVEGSPSAPPTYPVGLGQHEAIFVPVEGDQGFGSPPDFNPPQTSSDHARSPLFVTLSASAEGR